MDFRFWLNWVGLENQRIVVKVITDSNFKRLNSEVVKISYRKVLHLVSFKLDEYLLNFFKPSKISNKVLHLRCSNFNV